MELNRLLELDVGFAYSVNNISISCMLNNIEKGDFALTEYEEKEIPLEATIYKIVKGIPINIVSTAKRIDGKTQWNIVKGNNELRNIIKWIQDGVTVTINGKNATFENLDEDGKKFILNERHPLISTIIDSKYGFDKGSLSSDDLMEIIHTYS